ncbi:MAG: S24 family peptidase [Acidobacteria bacterium]|nr:S24 family peptidase [Acidobacteriota bacterium]
MKFPRVFLNGFSLPPPDACRVVSVSGDGMEPTMSDGDKMLIDARFTALVDGRVYTVSTPEGLVTRRAKRWRQGWLLVRDKPGRPSMALPANAKVLGEVRWVARTLRPDEPTDELLSACERVAGGSALPGKP